MTLKDQVAEFVRQKEVIMKNYPSITGIWFEIDNVPMDELRDAQVGSNKLYYSEVHKKMILQGPYVGTCSDITIFARSKEVSVKEHIVIDEAIVNV